MNNICESGLPVLAALGRYPVRLLHVRRGRMPAGALCVVMLIAGVLGTAGTTNAQSVRLQVKDAKPVQVIEDVPLVPGKATAIRVTINASVRAQARLQVTLGASAQTSVVTLAKGNNTLYVRAGAPGGPGKLAYTVRVSPVAGGTESNFSGQTDVVALQRSGLRVLFLPLDWTDQDRARGFPGQFNSFVATSSDFFRATYPLAEGNIDIRSTTTPHILTPEQRAIVDAQGNFQWGNITDMYNSVVAAGHRSMPDADLVVGVLPPKWYARALHDPTVVGLELNSVRSAVSSQVDSDYATLAHEAGHVFGRTDDYDFNINPARIGNKLDASGYWVAKNKSINPGSKPVYYSFMGASDPGSQFWVDRATYLAILQTLQSGIELGP